MDKFSKAELKEFESELLTLYPFFSEHESKKITEEMIIYWTFIIKNIN